MAEPSIFRKQRDFVAARANDRCEYCHSPLDFCPDPFCIEHIIPRAGGGANDVDNLAFSCQGCHSYQYTSLTAIDPITGEVVVLYHPRHDCWEEHFTWSEDYLILTGISPKGRATIERLHLRLYLNRPGVVNLRRVLRKVGERP